MRPFASFDAMAFPGVVRRSNSVRSVLVMAGNYSENEGRQCITGCRENYGATWILGLALGVETARCGNSIELLTCRHGAIQTAYR